MESTHLGKVQPLLFQNLPRNLEASQLVHWYVPSHVMLSGLEAIKTERDTARPQHIHKNAETLQK